MIGMISAFVSFLWYSNLDRKTEQYDEELREDIEQKSDFSGITRAAHPKFITTSDSTFSKSKAIVEKQLGKYSGKPDKLVVVSGDNENERKIEMIRERVREIPGKNILASELVAAIRNHYAYRLALSREKVGSRVVEHFKSERDEYEFSNRVTELAQTDSYYNVTIFDESSDEEGSDPLNDIFLRIVEAAEQYCVAPAEGIEQTHETIEDCQSILMLTFFGLYAQSMKGAKIGGDRSRDQYINGYRSDIRDDDNWGYWILPKNQCDEEDFERIRYIGWKIEDILNEHWRNNIYSTLYTKGDSIREMEYVETPFLIFQKDEEQFRGGGHGSDG